ncbi:MAG TPA: hypothetical protein RMH99_24085 [Sandaracinaceae bacterium LLY-WYZ-13_1]|nr:hypothetical protein [Sandaracinaceae bacterium LLY-WYZ-13_1]
MDEVDERRAGGDALEEPSRAASSPPRGFYPAAVALPCALWALHHSLGHGGDIGFFHEWYLAFREGPGFYRDGPGLNYPIVGVLLTCGPAALVEGVLGRPLDAATYRVVLKATLVAGEILLIVGAERLARALGAARPARLALGIYALPVVWAGGAFFGQTDPWGTALLLLSAAGLAAYHRGGDPRALALGLLAGHAAILQKQLTWFAVPGLAALALVALRRRGRRLHWALALASPLLLVAPDPFLALPEGHASHLWFVLAGGGSSHGELAVASGASAWALFVPGGTPASSLRFAGLDAFAWGWIAWAAAMALATAWVRRRRFAPVALVALAGLGQLAMATLLTGVHERYLAHAVPLLLTADAAMRAGRPTDEGVLGSLRTPAGRPALGVAVGVLAGGFVLATLEPAYVGPLRVLARPEPTALLALAWLGAFLAAPASIRATAGEPVGTR